MTHPRLSENSDTGEPAAAIRTLIADDHPLVLLAVEHLLSGFPNIRIVGRASNSDEVLALAEETRCDLVVMGGDEHSQLRERVLGGAPRAMLAAMTVPVLMSH